MLPIETRLAKCTVKLEKLYVSLVKTKNKMDKTKLAIKDAAKLLKRLKKEEAKTNFVLKVINIKKGRPKKAA